MSTVVLHAGIYRSCYDIKLHHSLDLARHRSGSKAQEASITPLMQHAYADGLQIDARYPCGMLYAGGRLRWWMRPASESYQSWVQLEEQLLPTTIQSRIFPFC